MFIFQSSMINSIKRLCKYRLLRKYMNKRYGLISLKFILTVFVWVLCLEVSAQKAVVKGIVKDAYSNDPIPFVNMIIYNTQIGTATDIDGQFTLEVDGFDFIQLKLSSVGYTDLVTEEIYLSGFRTNFIEILMEPSSEAISEVVVKPNVFVAKKENPVSLRRIGIDQIEKSAGANRDISKVIQSFPGVASTVSFRNDILVRGGGPAENKFYIDGIEIPTINHFSTQGASGGPVGILNVDFIREVDFYSGAFPASRGNALSSVLEFKQLDGNQEDSDIRAVLGASELALSVSSPLSDKTTVLASVRRSYLQFLFKALDLPFLPTFTDFQFKTKTRINKKNEISFLGFGALDDFELNKEAGDTPENRYILSYIPVNKQKSYTIGTNYKHYFDKSYLTFVLSRNYLNNTAIKYKDNIELKQNLIYDYSSDEVENKFRAEFNSKGDKLSVNLGVALESGYYSNSTFRKDVVGNEVVDFNYDSELEVIKYGLFGALTQSFFDNRFSITMGLRADANSYSSSMRNLLDQISPRLALSYKLNTQLTLSTSYGKYFQLPAYTSLGFRNEQGVLVNKYNDLKYISSEHFIVGMDFMPNDYTKLTVEGFYKNYNNYPFSVNDSISLASKGGDFGVIGDEEVTPAGEGRALGFELMARQKSSKGYNFIASYTFVKSEFKDAWGDYIPSSWDSRHIFSATISKKMKKNWDLGLKWRYLGGMPYTPVDENKTSLKQNWDAQGREYLDFSRFNELRMTSFHQLDLRVDKQYLFKNWALGFYLDIQNLYNYKLKEPAKYVLEYDELGMPVIQNPDAPEQEQRYSFTKLFTESGTVLPTIGVKVEF